MAYGDEFKIDNMIHDLWNTRIFEFMREKKIHSLQVNFSGEGDSGDFDDWISIDLNLPGYHNEDAYHEVQTAFENSAVIPSIPNTKKTELPQLMRFLAEKYEYEADHNVDWVNNEGGQGSVKWTSDGKVILLVQQRVITFEDHYFEVATGNIAHPDPIPMGDAEDVSEAS